MRDGLINLLVTGRSRPVRRAGEEDRVLSSRGADRFHWRRRDRVEVDQREQQETDVRDRGAVSALTGGANPNFEKFNQARAAVTRKVAGFKKDMQPEGEEEEPRPEGSMGSDLSVGYDVAGAGRSGECQV